MAEPALAPPTPAQLLAQQGGVVTRKQLEDALGGAALRRGIRSGAWVLVDRGVYAPRELAGDEDKALQHRLKCAACILASARDLVVCGTSAALLHGLRMLDPHDGAPQLVIPRPAGTEPRHVRELLAAGLPAGQRQLLEGLPITTPARTVADLARTLDRPAAVVMADAALRDGVDRMDVIDVLGTCRRWPGVQNAIDAVIFADRRSESPLESLARVWFSEADLPAPQLQAKLCHADDGRFVARVDFFWPQHRTVCEVDGRVKYDGGGTLWHEKLREDTLRDLGLEVVRGYWSDRPGDALVERLRRSFARAARRIDEPRYGVLL